MLYYDILYILVNIDQNQMKLELVNITEETNQH